VEEGRSIKTTSALLACFGGLHQYSEISKVSIDIPSLLKKSYDVFESIDILIAMTLVTRYAATVL